MSMWIISRGGVLLILLELGYRVLIDLILHRSSINNSAILSNKFGGFYFIFKFGISGLLHQVITTIADRIRGLVVHVFNQGYDLIACLNKAMAFLIVVASLRFPSTNNQLRTSSNPRNQATIQYNKVKVTWIGNALSQRGLGTLHGLKKRQCWLKHRILTEDLDSYDSDCDDVSNAKAILMANLLYYGSDVISEVPHFEPSQTDMHDQSVHAMQGFEQTPVVDFTDNEITSDSNIIPYSRYLQEMQQEAVQDTNLYAQQDSMILSVIEQMSEQMIKHKIDSLEQNLSNQIKEKESLLQSFTVFKNESKEKESKYMYKEIDLEKKIKELDNIVYKVGQSAQTVHMLTKPQVFYDNAHKQALGYQNPFYLKKALQIKPTLYDGSVIPSQHAASPVIDVEETLILEEVSRSKMLAKQNDTMSKEKKVNTNIINYVELNRLSEEFGKLFVPQQELSDEHAFWLQTSHPNTDQSASSPVKIEAPKELPKVSLVDTSLKKLKYHLGQFDTVVKKWITPDAITEGKWGFEHPKTVFLNEIILFLKTSKDIFNVFDKHLLNEVTEVQTVFNQIEAAVQQYFVEKQYVMMCMMNSTDIFDDVNVEMQSSEYCVKCLDLDAEIKHLKKIYKDQFDSIKKIRALSKEHYDSLIAQLNYKSMENADLKGQIQENFFVTTALQNELKKLKGKNVLDNAATITNATSIAPGMFKLALDPLAPRLLTNRDAYIDYHKYTQDQADTLRGIVEQAKAKQPLDNALDFACKHGKRIQELLVCVRDTCPNAYKPSKKLVAVTPMINVKKVRFSEPLTSSSNISAATWRAVIGQPPVTFHRSHRRTPVNGGGHRRSTVAHHRSTTVGPPVNHRQTTGQRWRSTGLRVPRGSATLAGGDPLSDVSSDVAPCGDDVEIAKKAMEGFETMTSRS
ncbi:hypothetical protein Tco_0637092 [Tanacetum coccineum]